MHFFGDLVQIWWFQMGAHRGRPPKSLFLSWNHQKCTESPKKRWIMILAKPHEEASGVFPTLLISRSISEPVKLLVGPVPYPLWPGRSNSELGNWLLGLILNPLRPGRSNSKLKNWELGLILTPIKLGRPNSKLLELVWRLLLFLSSSNQNYSEKNVREKGTL